MSVHKETSPTQQALFMTHSSGMSPCALMHFEPPEALNWEWTAGDALQ